MKFCVFFRYLYLIKTKFGVEAEMLVEEFLRKGFDSASQVIVRAASRLKETRQGLYLYRKKYLVIKIYCFHHEILHNLFLHYFKLEGLWRDLFK